MFQRQCPIFKLPQIQKSISNNTSVLDIHCPVLSHQGCPQVGEALDLSQRPTTLVKLSSILWVADSQRVSICERFTRICRPQANIKHTTNILNKKLNLNIQEKTYTHIYHSTLNTLSAIHSLWLAIQHSSRNPIFQSSQLNNYIV
jgi:hypothetical protein